MIVYVSFLANVNVFSVVAVNKLSNLPDAPCTTDFSKNNLNDSAIFEIKNDSISNLTLWISSFEIFNSPEIRKVVNLMLSNLALLSTVSANSS